MTLAEIKRNMLYEKTHNKRNTLSNIEYCDEKSCPVHRSNEESSFTSLILTQELVPGFILEVMVPCLLCSKRKLLEFDKILKKENIKDLLRQKHFDTEV